MWKGRERSWSHLGCVHQAFMTKRHYFYLLPYFAALVVSLRGKIKLESRPDWSLLGVQFKCSDENPPPFHMGFLPRAWLWLGFEDAQESYEAIALECLANLPSACITQ